MGRSGYTFVRFSFCTLNLLMWLIGCGLLGVGIWLYLVYEGYATLLPSYAALSADSLCISAGVVTFMVAFLGCCGSWFQNRCLLIMYFILVTIIFAMEFTAATLAFVYRENVAYALKNELKEGIKKNYRGTGEQGFTNTWDHFQQEFDCCGVNEYTDWHNIAAWPDKIWVPDSCCKDSVENKTDCGKSPEKSDFYEKGCIDKLHMWLIERMHIMGIIVLVFAFVQLFGLIASMLLFCTLRHRRKMKLYR